LEQDSPQLAQHLLTESSLGSRNQASGLLLAQAALASGEYLTALQALENARDGKDSPEIRLLLATVHWKRGDLEKAQSVLDEVLSASPADTDAWCLLGEVRLAMGHLPEAREAFERAIFVDPECGWAAAQLSGMRVPVKPEITESKKILKRS